MQVRCMCMQYDEDGSSGRRSQAKEMRASEQRSGQMCIAAKARAETIGMCLKS